MTAPVPESPLDHNEWMDECAAVLMKSWGLSPDDEDGYDGAIKDVTTLLKAGLVSRA